MGIANGSTADANDLLVSLMASGVVKYGLNASKTATPVPGNIYITSDTNTFYFCSVANVWIPLVATPQTNPIALKVITASVAITNSAAETNFVSYTVPGGTFSTANMIRGEVRVSLANNSGSSNDFTVNVKYGGTTVCTFRKFTHTSGADLFGLVYRFWIKATGATNAQQGQAAPLLWGAEGADGNGGVINTSAIATASIDSTANQILLITGKHSVAHANTSATMRIATLELLTAV